MPIRKWVLQACIALPVLFLLFASIQYFKGKPLEYSLEFGAFWSAVSITIFFASRVYYFKKGMACKVCNDVPNEENS